jgi:ketosteroid isomerase-like protein
MSEESVELVRNAFDRAGVGNLAEVARTYWHPDSAAQYQGRDAVLRCFQAYMEALGPAEDGGVSVERVFDAGERQVVFVHFRGRSASGVPHEHLWAYVVKLKDRRVVYFRAYYEPEEALEAAGLRE